MRFSRIQSYLLNGLRLAFDWRPWVGTGQTWNRRPALNALNLWQELRLGPLRALVDVGARESEFSKWILSECPQAKLISFEPDARLVPQGEIRREALSSVSGSGRLDYNCVCPCLDIEQSGPVLVRRYDSLGLRVPTPAMLKVDAEDSTFAALDGFGERLRDFSLVVAEIANCHPEEPRLGSYAETAMYKISRHMGKFGFVCARVLDCGPYVPGRVLSIDVAFWRFE